jgi:glycosyltransferase involved in cell wall biosynthesis
VAEIRIADTLVLIPAYNEEKNIERVTKAVRALGFPVLVVDDGSKDSTSVVASRAGAQVLTLNPNGGKGAALRKGLDKFLSERYPAVILMDADGQHDATETPSFIEALNNGADLVVGSRMECTTGMPWERVATNRLLSWLISLVAGWNIPDTQCGYRAMTRDTAQKIKLITNRYEIESEMLLEAAKHKKKIVSIPIRCVYEGGKSQIHPWKDTYRFARFIVHYLIFRTR